MVFTESAYGQVPVPESATQPATLALTPPKLVTFVEAIYPAAAKAAQQQADVDLSLTIDATGKVTLAQAITPVGHGFDEAAVEAAQQFVFEPAKRGNQAIPARIRYRYQFVLATAPVPTTGEMEGQIRARDSDQVIAGARISLLDQDGTPLYSTTSDGAGKFRFQDLSPGRVQVQLVAPNGTVQLATEEVTAGDITQLIYRMELNKPQKGGAPIDFGATATIQAPPREVTKRSLSGEELLRVAGTRGDPLNAIEYMPGVGRSPEAEFIIIRGSSPMDSEVQFEGTPVYRLYHFGGLTSFVQPRLLDQIDLYPGNFSARYGRKMGGIVDVGIRDPKTDHLHGMLDINLIDSSFLLEGPINQNWSFALAAKRSYIDLFIRKLIPKDEVRITTAPVYWDYQAILAYKPSRDDRFRAMVYGSYDDLTLILANPIENDPTIRGGLSSNTAFHRAQLTWEHHYNPSIEHEIHLSTGPFKFAQSVGPEVGIMIPGYEGFLRSEWRARIRDQFRLIAGLDVEYHWFKFDYHGPKPKPLDGDPETFGPLTGQSTVALKNNFGIWRAAAYLEAIWQPTPWLSLVPGGRVDYLDDVQRWTFDPRITARAQVAPRTMLKGGVGLFSQAPNGIESLPVLGNPHLRPARAEHYSAGLEQDLGLRWKITAEGFYKRLKQVSVSSPIPGENLNNDGIGRIYGTEVSAKLRGTAKSSGFLSYTLSRSERNDHGKEWRLFNWDQTHILTLAGSYQLGRSWEVSGTFRYVTGNPLTPAVGSIYNANTDTYKPLYGAINSGRSNDFHRLDLRIEKRWTIGAGNIAAYLDVQNTYNRRNEEGRSYNYNYTQSGVISGLPILPSLGVRGEI
jgi:TonB family protein